MPGFSVVLNCTVPLGVTGKAPVTPKGTVQFKVTLKPGTYDYFCTVPGHRAAGMSGKLTVR